MKKEPLKDKIRVRCENCKLEGYSCELITDDKENPSEFECPNCTSLDIKDVVNKPLKDKKFVMKKRDKFIPIKADMTIFTKTSVKSATKGLKEDLESEEVLNFMASTNYAPIDKVNMVKLKINKWFEDVTK